MPLAAWIGLPVVFFGMALLYSAVGHAGASGYLAAMALFGLDPQVMKPTALALNVLVAAIVSVKFYRAGCFSWSKFWPFAATSIPFAFIGGSISLPGSLYRPAVGLVLLYAAFRMFRASQTPLPDELRPIPVPAGLASGAAIGLLSGLTGVGGGIFLTPLLLLMHWAEPRQAAGISAVFILSNSIAGLFGSMTSLGPLPPGIWGWGLAAVLGGWIGAELGSRQLGSVVLRRLLALVLVIAGIKIMLT
jgi:uncharacterized membrane protein YfcA